MNRWLKLVEQFAPIVLANVQGVPKSVIPFVVHGVQTAEAIEGATGEQKLAAAQQIVADGVAALNTVKPNAIDSDAVNAAVAYGINATVQAVNAVHSATKPAVDAAAVVASQG